MTRIPALIATLLAACLCLAGCEHGSQADATVPADGGPSGRRSPAATTQPEKLVPLKRDLPAPHTYGCGRSFKREPNMGPRYRGERPAFLVPRGTANLARGKDVTSSDSEPIVGELKYATDGEKAGGHGYFVELATGKQWVMIDLQAEAKIYAIVVWHYWKDQRVYRDVAVQVSQDSGFADCTTVFNNDHDNSSGLGTGVDKGYVEDHQGKLIDCKGVQGRYVRLWSKENTTDESNHYIEVEVYGKPVK